jgi:hypothetical protein
LTISWQTCDAALTTAASLPEAAWSHRLVSLPLASDDRFGAAEIRCLQAATAAWICGLLARLPPPEGDELVGAADDVVVALVGAELLELAADVAAVVLDEELLPPQPAMTAATTASVANVLIMVATLIGLGGIVSVDSGST